MRDGIRCLAAARKRLYHWGLRNVARSTFADANNSRPMDFFKNLFGEMYALCAVKAPKYKFRFKSKLLSMDATTIKLCLSLFPWASFRQGKGGIKMHTVLDHNGGIPMLVTITDAKSHESRIAKATELPRGSIVVFDNGYINYSWFHELGDREVFFVTRLKRNARYKLLERRSVNRKTRVTSDHIIEVTTCGKKLRLRRIGYRDQASGKHYEFLTKHFRLSPKTIADIYKDLWQIELFFKEIKQNLRIKHFVSNSENAVMIQLYTALTVYLLLAYQKFLSRICLSVQQVLEIIQFNLFGTFSMEEPLHSRRKENNNTYEFSLLSCAA